MSRLYSPLPPVFRFERWFEDQGDVLWFKYPIFEPAYCGTPLDLGRRFRVTVDGVNYNQNVGGWPFREDEEDKLFWSPLPNCNDINNVIRLMSLESNEKE